MAKGKPSLWTRNFIIITALNALLYFSFQMLMPVFSLVIKELGGSETVVGLNAAFMTVAILLIRPLSGIATDRFGRGLILLTGIIVLLAAVFLSGQFILLWALFIFRFILGLGYGASTTACSSAATDFIPKKRFGEGMSFFSLSMSLSLALAPGAGLLIYGATDYTRLTLIVCGIAAAALILSLNVRYQHNDHTHRTRTFKPYEKSSLRPSAIIFCATTFMGTVNTFMPLYGEQLNISVGFFFTAIAVTLFISRLFLGKLIDRFGPDPVVFIGFAFYTAAALLLFSVRTYAGIMSAGALMGIAYGAAQVSLQTLALINTPAERTGAANATFYSGIDAGVGFGGIFGGVLAPLFGYNVMFLMLLVPIGAGVAMHMRFSKSASIPKD